MKRLKRLWMTILIVVISVSVIIGGAGISAFAADSITNANDMLAAAATLPKTVYLGEPITIPAGTSLKVTAPDGADVTSQISGGSLTAKMLGNYTISYGAVEKYLYNVNCKLEKEYELRVENGGAEVPTHVAAGNKIKLPAAKLFYKDTEKNEYVECLAADYAVEIKVGNKVFENGKFQGESADAVWVAAEHTVQYTANLKKGSDTLKKYFTKGFTVKAQTGFKDEVAPTLSVASVPKDASLNTKVTLPKATANDTFDTNPLVKITVKKGDADVKAVEVNDYGYATAAKADNQYFDNINNLSFYPRETGTYTVTYQAFDDTNIYDETKGKSTKYTFNIEVSDRTAPKLEEIDDTMIPSKWGKTVENKAKNNDGKINFPFPVFSDNDTNADAIKISFTVTDTVNNKVVIKFDNINETSGGNEYTYNSAKPGNGIYNKNTAESTKETFSKTTGFAFDLSKYVGAVDAGVSTTGKYTAVYVAKDSKGNTSSQVSYDITVDEKLVDDKAPSVTLETDDYLYVESATEYQKYTLPTATVTDAVDSRPEITYEIWAGATKLASVKNGAEIEINETNIKVEDDETPIAYSGSKLTLKVSGKDDVGNVSDIVEKNIYLAKTSDVTANVTLSITPTWNQAALKAGEGMMNIGSIKINSFADATENSYRKFNGFELSLQDPNGDLIDGMSLETYIAESSVAGKKEINIDKLSFAPGSAGFYTLTVRAFDITGRSLVKAYKIEVGAGSTSGGTVSAVAVPVTGNVNVSYKLRNEIVKDNPSVPSDLTKNYIVRKISQAGKFSLMGVELTAYTAGTYWFNDGIYLNDNTFRTLGDAYWTTITDNSNPVFEVLGVMPTYAPKSTAATSFTDNTAIIDTWTVQLPKVIAFNDYANAEITVVVKDLKGNRELNIGSTGNANEVMLNSDGGYAFDPKSDGEYQVTYTATVPGSGTQTAVYTIKVGDNVAPAFTLKNPAPSSSYSQTLKATFEFKEMVFVEETDGDKKADVTFTKRLLDPSNKVVYEVSGKDSTASYATKKVRDDGTTYKFDSSGKYTVEYVTKDAAGNTNKIIENIDVTSSKTANPVPLKVLRTVLILVGILVLAGVVYYFVRFRKVKAIKK